MKKQNIKISGGKNEIYGTLYLPSFAAGAEYFASESVNETENSIPGNRFPLIIMSHGFNGIGDDFVREAEYLSQNGIAAFSFDFCGGSSRSRSTGKTTDMTIFSEKDDLLKVYSFLKAKSEIDENRIFLLGGSMGGLVTALLAEELGDKIAGAIMYFPALCIADDWRVRFSEASSIPDTYKLWDMTIGRNYFETIRNFYVFENIGKYQGDVLIIHGDRDEIVPLEYSQKAVKLYKKAELVVLENEGHGFGPNGVKKACEIILRFTKNIIKKLD